MLVPTHQFGPIEIPEDRCFQLLMGMDGRNNLGRFGLISRLESSAGSTLRTYLQNLDDSNMLIMVIDAMECIPGYVPLINEEIHQILHSTHGDPVLIYLPVEKTSDRIAVDFHKPFILSLKTHRGVQILTPSPSTHRPPSSVSHQPMAPVMASWLPRLDFCL